MKTIRWCSSALRNYDNFVFDCDGVLWYGKEFIPGVVEALKKLHELNKTIFFCTNSSGKSRKDVVARFHDVGLNHININNVCTSASAVASFIYTNYYKNTHFDITKDKVFAIGGLGLKYELESRGIKVELASDIVNDDLNVAKTELDPNFRIVVSAFDPKVNYNKIAYALRLLSERNCLFVSSNQDATYPASSSVFMPGAGMTVAALTMSSKTIPFNVGKPSTLMMSTLVGDHDLNPSRTLMVGDRRDTDCQFGNDSGMHSMLVLTGVLNYEDVTSQLEVLTYDIDNHPEANDFRGTDLKNVFQNEKYSGDGVCSVIQTLGNTTKNDIPTYIAGGMPWIVGDMTLPLISENIINEETKKSE